MAAKYNFLNNFLLNFRFFSDFYDFWWFLVIYLENQSQGQGARPMKCVSCAALRYPATDAMRQLRRFAVPRDIFRSAGNSWNFLWKSRKFEWKIGNFTSFWGIFTRFCAFLCDLGKNAAILMTSYPAAILKSTEIENPPPESLCQLSLFPSTLLHATTAQMTHLGLT